MKIIKKYWKCKCGNFGYFILESRVKIVKWVCEYGYISVVKCFFKELMRDVNEFIVRLIKK